MKKISVNSLGVLKLIARVGSVLGMSLLIQTSNTLAQENYPNRPVILMNPWAAGGPSEAIIRPIAEKLTQLLGQPFVIEAKPGANGTIGSGMVAHAKPDGYTLLFANAGPITISPSLPNKPTYDSVRDFVPITQIVSAPTLLVVRSDFPAKNLVEFIEYIKKNPNKVAYGSVGIGSTTHLAGATLAERAGTQMIHIPYTGSSQINTDILGGQIQTAFVNIAGVMGLVSEGKLRPLAVSTLKRVSLLPNVPSVAEQMPEFEMNSWYGLMAPANTPIAVTQKLNAAVIQALKTPEIIARLRDYGLEVEGTSSDAFSNKIKSDIANYANMVKAAKIKD
jgi:tripartite-type tricarboxylate transporter receptor subunit TctC